MTKELRIGQKLRTLREAQDLSLRGLADKCGMSFNTISRIERNETSPTVATLHILAQTLNIPISKFFEDSYEQSVIFVKAAERIRSTANGVMMESLGVGLQDQKLEPFLVTVTPGEHSHTSPITHNGEEFVYCLAGVLTYEINEVTYELAEGDSLLFDATQPHRFYNEGKQEARFVVVFQGIQNKYVVEHHYLDH